ncbi:type-F conjugative transfer system pilin assembly thiol-disulfide isomerase TrbB [Xenorhabdus sp. XENO-1]|uniref:type-F conjugative transfer system pilin assembly thiol-disulfide isomerase TrbB n=1 Tax=Xenorhabdus bovienii TaxID=40576 RepID=UPI0020CA68C0|nr:type-F conjugative transfer system pilin assembly thiol-disulfide isomerase TrbB [Xenorhabdus bovienii]MCP9269153.1 type-F conjugative transfer system pilin assembly thiol-disulfide isomerase TrbB [Xenorhabdus bovienii subsp. africana]
MISLGIIVLSGINLSYASTRNEIEALYNPKGVSAVIPTPSPTVISPPKSQTVPRWFTLSNGKYINLAEWKVVLFMQGQCPYCHQFDPVLKGLEKGLGLSVFAYSIDGQGDVSYPNALLASPDVMQTFFPNIPIATPTTFLVNVNTLETWPLLQGATDERGFLSRLDTVFQIIKAENQHEYK